MVPLPTAPYRKGKTHFPKNAPNVLNGRKKEYKKRIKFQSRKVGVSIPFPSRFKLVTSSIEFGNKYIF